MYFYCKTAMKILLFAIEIMNIGNSIMWSLHVKLCTRISSWICYRGYDFMNKWAQSTLLSIRTLT